GEWAAPVGALAEARPAAVVHEALIERLREDGQRAEVLVVPLALARQRRPQRVVDVVAPLRVDPVAAGDPRPDDSGIVQVALGDEEKRPALHRGQRLDLDRELL